MEVSIVADFCRRVLRVAVKVWISESRVSIRLTSSASGLLCDLVVYPSTLVFQHIHVKTRHHLLELLDPALSLCNPLLTRLQIQLNL